jgi:hypothetical protein
VSAVFVSHGVGMVDVAQSGDYRRWATARKGIPMSSSSVRGPFRNWRIVPGSRSGCTPTGSASLTPTS